jgi:hypothetical protein
MIYKGLVKRGPIELAGEGILPEGTRVSSIPDKPVAIDIHASARTLKDWLRGARQFRVQLSKTGKSVEIWRYLREERAER